MPLNAARGSEPESTNRSAKDQAKPTPRRPRRTTRLVSVLALALALVALVVAFLVPGPPSPGSLMAHASHGGPVTIGAACTHYPEAEVSLTVPGAGTVVVSATVGVGINHTAGLNDEARIVVAASSTECAVNNYTAFVSVPFSLPTDPFHFTTVPLLRPFPVSGPSTVTFYVNGVMAWGADTGDRFDSASLVAVYYSR